MAAGRELEVTGDRELIAGFDELARYAGDLTEAHRAVVGALVPEVRAATPRRTGALAVSWSTSADKSSGSILSPLPYAGPVEFGVAGRFEGRAMVRSVLDSSSDAIVAGYEEALADKAKSIGFAVTR